MKQLLKIGANDLSPLIKGYSLQENVLVKDEGRNARGNAMITIINRKQKISVVFRPTNEAEMASIAASISSFVLNITYWDTKTQTQKTSMFYHNGPTADFYTNRNEEGLFNEMAINFIEL